MASYRASVMDAETGGENRYPFEGPDDLMDRTPVQIVRFFMEHVDRRLLPAEKVDYELNFAVKNEPHRVVTAAGSLVRERGGTIPFLMMIGPA